MRDLENNKNLTSLTIHDFSCGDWCSEGFQKDFCGRLLSKNRLTKLEMNWDQMNEDDQEAFVNAGMSNLLELRHFIPAKLIRGEEFGNLRILYVAADSDEDLVIIGNHCFSLEVLEMLCDESTTGSFLTSENLVEGAFKHLRELLLVHVLSGFDVGTGFSRLHSLETLCIAPFVNFDDSCLKYLPNPDRLRTIFMRNDKFLMSNLHRFVNLEEIDLHHFHLSREDILSFALFKKLKRISLGNCGKPVASSKPFRILCPRLPNLETLCCEGRHTTRWTEEDVEIILVECKWLRRLDFRFKGDVSDGTMYCERMVAIKKKYPWVTMEGVLQRKNETSKLSSGSRRKREE